MREGRRTTCKSSWRCKYVVTNRNLREGFVFSILALGNPSTTKAQALQKKLVGLKALPLADPATLGNSNNDLKSFASTHKQFLKQFYYGVYDQKGKNEEECSGSNETDEEELEDE